MYFGNGKWKNWLHLEDAIVVATLPNNCSKISYERFRNNISAKIFQLRSVSIHIIFMLATTNFIVNIQDNFGQLGQSLEKLYY